MTTRSRLVCDAMAGRAWRVTADRAMVPDPGRRPRHIRPRRSGPRRPRCRYARNPPAIHARRARARPRPARGRSAGQPVSQFAPSRSPARRSGGSAPPPPPTASARSAGSSRSASASRPPRSPPAPVRTPAPPSRRPRRSPPPARGSPPRNAPAPLPRSTMKRHGSSLPWSGTRTAAVSIRSISAAPAPAGRAAARPRPAGQQELQRVGPRHRSSRPAPRRHGGRATGRQAPPHSRPSTRSTRKSAAAPLRYSAMSAPAS